jgi:hypothetical protein
MPSSAQGGVSVPSFEPDEIKHRRRIAVWAGSVQQGKINCTGQATLQAGTVSTTVADARVGINTVVILAPATAKALSARPTVVVSTVTRQSFTIAHSATAAVNKTFRYALLT